MFQIIKKFHKYFNINRVKGSRKIFFGFILTLPHILTCLILILLFPEQWIGIIIVGLILPDFSYIFFTILYLANSVKEKKYPLTSRKTVAHLLTFVLVVILLLSKEYILVLAGGIHLFFDLLGF